MTPPVPSPIVAAVVPIRNRKAKTLRFLDLLARQTYAHLRIYVVDSNSSDGSVEAVAAAFPEVQTLTATDHDYWTGATNIGVRRALADGCDYILTINDDSVILDDFVERLVGTARAHGCHILGCRIDHLATPGLVWSIGARHEWGTADLFFANYGGLREEQLPPLVRDAVLLPVESMPGNGVLIDRGVFEKIGLYDSRFTPHYHADTEFGLRARRAGLVPMVTPRVVLYNDFEPQDPQRTGLVSSFRRMVRSLLSIRSHWCLLPHAYIILRYGPRGLRVRSLVRYLARVYRFSFASVGIGRRAGLFVAHRVLSRTPRLRRLIGGAVRRAVSMRRP